MRDVGDDLQRVAVPADLRAVVLGLNARLIDEVLRRAAAEDDRGGSRPPDDHVRRLDDVADDIDVAGAGEIRVKAGVVTGLTNKSGHYQPTVAEMVQVFEELERGGDLDGGDDSSGSDDL